MGAAANTVSAVVGGMAKGLPSQSRLTAQNTRDSELQRGRG